MVAGVLFFVLAVLLVVMVYRAVLPEERGNMLLLVASGYVARPILFLGIMRSVAFFSHGAAGGDCMQYERLGSLIARRWMFEPIHFVANDELPQLGTAALPCNALALLELLAGEPQPLAGTILNAFVACWTVLIIYRFVRDGGVAPRVGLALATATLFGPAFLYHTSDTYKDGLNTFLVVSSLISSVRLSQRFEPQRLIYLGLSLWALWYVRHYMVFMCLVPFAVGVVGTGEATVPRRFAAAGLMVAICGAMVLLGSADGAYATAEQTFEYATSESALTYNATHHSSGSGVLTDSLAVRLIYTVFAPFPWQGGSFGLQLGKIESVLVYVYLYLVYVGRSRLWTFHRSTLMMLGLFVVPAVVAYAMTMSNVGLIVRQRMPIVVVLGILAALAYHPVSSRDKTPSLLPARV